MSFYKHVNTTINEDLDLITCNEDSSGNVIMESLDVHAIRELEIYIDDDRKLYDIKINTYYKNLILKICQGRYDSKKAVDLFMHFVERAAKRYSSDFGSTGTWNEIFPKKEREDIAKNLVVEFESAIKNKEYDWTSENLLPKKYANIDLFKSLKQGRAVMKSYA